jgi:predicted DNA-binding transcriptional regulator AlpA
MDYYNVKDIMELTGCGKSYSYEIITKLKKQFEEEYPDAISITGKIPKWYFEKKMKNKEV